MARGNQRDKAREKNQKEAGAQKKKNTVSHDRSNPKSDGLFLCVSLPQETKTDTATSSLAIGYRVPAYQRAAGGYNAPETGGRYVRVVAKDACSLLAVRRDPEGGGQG